MADDLHIHYLALGFHDDPSEEVAWLALVQKFLVDEALAVPGMVRRPSVATQAGVDEALVAFMEIYGDMFWPGTASARSRAALPLTFDDDVSFRVGAQTNGRASPLRAESIAVSEVREHLATYFRVVLRAPVPEDAGDADEWALIQTIMDARSAVGPLAAGASMLGDGDDAGTDDRDREEVDGVSEEERGGEQEGSDEPCNGFH